MADASASVAPPPQGATDAERAVQDRLAHAIERAQVGEDRALAQEVRESGEQLAGLLYGLLRTGRLYAADNKAFDGPVAELCACVAKLAARLGPVSLVCVEDQVYLNDVRVRFGEKSGKPGELGADHAKHIVGSVTFHVAPTEATVRALIGGFGQPPDGASPRAALERSLAARKVKGVELGGINRFPKIGEKSGRDAVAREAREIAERGIDTIGAVWTRAAAGQVINALALRRMVSELLAVGTTADPIWRAGADAPPHVRHAMHVNLLALTLGEAVGLREAALQDLGVAAVLHDVGYAPSATLPVEATHLSVHPFAGARVHALRRGFHEAKVRRVLATLDHHRDFANPRGKPSLFGRILRIVEDFDTYCRPSGGGLSPAEALVALQGGAGSRYDPALLQLLVNRLGRFPPNTLLLLEDGRIVETTSLVDAPASFAAPRAVVRRFADGRAPSQEILIDLAIEGRPRRLLRALPR